MQVQFNLTEVSEQMDTSNKPLTHLNSLFSSTDSVFVAFGLHGYEDLSTLAAVAACAVNKRKQTLYYFSS